MFWGIFQGITGMIREGGYVKNDVNHGLPLRCNAKKQQSENK